MKQYALIVYPRTDGDICDADCPLLFGDVAFCAGFCAGFDTGLNIVSSADHRYVRCADCCEAERQADERAAK